MRARYHFHYSLPKNQRKLVKVIQYQSTIISVKEIRDSSACSDVGSDVGSDDKLQINKMRSHH